MNTPTIHRAALETAPRWVGLLAALLVLWSQPVPVHAQLADAPWPKYGGDLRNTGQSAYGGGGTSWNSDLGNRASGSPAIAADGTIYVMVDDSGNQLVYALNPDGTPKGGAWPVALDDGRGMQPIIGPDGIIYVGIEDSDVPPNDGKLYAIRPDGTIKWQLDVDDMLSPPTLSADEDLLISGSGNTYSIDISTGVPIPNWINGQPAESVQIVWTDGRPYAAYFDGGIGKVLALDASDGGSDEIYTDVNARFSSLAISDDNVAYVTGSKGTPSTSTLFAVDLDGRSLLWSTEIDDGAFLPIVGEDGSVYVRSDLGSDGVLQCFSAAGDDLGTITLTGDLSFPALSNEGVLYVTAQRPGKDRLHAIDAEACEEFWSVELEAEAKTNQPVIAADGTVYIATKSGIEAVRGPAPIAASGDFGMVKVGETFTKTITIRNEGGLSLSLTGVSIVGADASDFDTNDLATVVALLPGGEFTVDVTFAPTSAAGDLNRSAQLKFATLGGAIYSDLTGAVVEPLNLSAGALDLGEVLVGSGPSTATLTVENPNSVPISLFGISVSGDAEGSFAASTSTGSTLPANATALVNVAFTPQSPGSKTATLNVQSAIGTSVIGLQGDGLKVPVLSTTVLGFGGVQQGSSVESIFTLANTGAFDVALTGIDVQGAQASEYTITQGSTGTIGAGTTRQIAVTFAPAAAGPRAATVALTLDVGNTVSVEQTLSVTLDGIGVAPPQLSTETTALDFGAVAVGASTSQTFTLQNTGGAPLDVTGAAVTGNSAFRINGPSPKTLNAGESLGYTLTFAPGEGGALGGELVVTSSAGTASVRLDGLGVAAFLNAPDRSAVGTAADITVDLSDGYQPDVTRELCYRRGGEQAYQCETFATKNSGLQLAALIPAVYVTERGVDYYLSLSDGVAAITIPSDRPSEQPLHIQTYFDQIRMPGRFARRQYRMISTPTQLDASLTTLLEDSYGAAGTGEWRLMRWDPLRKVYQEYMGSETLARGESAWLVSHYEDAPQLGRGTSVDVTQPFEIIVEPGWNQIASPYPFPVAWSDVAGSEQVQPPVRYNGVEYEHNQVALRPWDGAFVYNPTGTPATLIVPPKEAAIPAATAQAKTAGSGYTLQLSAYLEGTPLRDTQNFIGFVANGRADVQMEAPAVGEHVRLSLVRGTERHAISRHTAAPGGHAWDIEVGAHIGEALPTSKQIRVHLGEQGKRPQGFDLYILDVDRRVRVPVSEQAFTAKLGAEQPVRRFRVIIGTEDFAATHGDGIPLDVFEYGLDASYPNPFKQETTIQYKLREPGTVTLDVYNILGQRVVRLVDERQGAGPHTARWDGRDERGVRVASGVYFYRLVAGDFAASNKMVVVR